MISPDDPIGRRVSPGLIPGDTPAGIPISSAGATADQQEKRSARTVRFTSAICSDELETNVTLNGQPLRVGAHIAEDAYGNKFCNLNQDLDAWAQKYQPPGVGPVFKSGVPGAVGGKASTTADIGAGGDGINLYILGPAALAATRSADQGRDPLPAPRDHERPGR